MIGSIYRWDGLELVHLLMQTPNRRCQDQVYVCTESVSGPWFRSGTGSGLAAWSGPRTGGTGFGCPFVPDPDPDRGPDRDPGPDLLCVSCYKNMGGTPCKMYCLILCGTRDF